MRVLKDSATDSSHGAPAGFEHDAFVHASDEEFVQRAAGFVRQGLAAGETIVAVLPPERIAVLRDALGPLRHDVCFTDMTVAGGNPARLIPFWRDILDQHPGPVRALGEPAYPGRSQAAYDEVLLHEALTGIAFAHDRSFRLCCAYEASVGIDPTATHSAAEALAEKGFRTALDDIPDRAEHWEFGPDDLGEIRQWVSGQAASPGLVNSTAYRQLVSANGANMKQGDVVLIWGASGGLGSYATQFALNGGATPVCVVSSPDKAEICRAMGAELVIDRSERTGEGYKFWKDETSQDPKEWKRLGARIRELTGGKDVDIVFEHPGRETFGASVYVARKGGTIVTCASRLAALVIPRPGSGARVRTPTLPWCRFRWTS